MAVATLEALIDRGKRAISIDAIKSGGSSGSLELCSMWAATFNAGSVPSTAAACNNTTVGALNRESTIGNTGLDYRLLNASILNSTASGQMLLLDRLSHQGGLSGTVTTAQTTNLPTAALTRYTSGAGVMAALEIYSPVGATVTTATVSYTNQAGTPGRTSKSFTFGGSATGSGSTRLIPIPLQDGDTGVRSVESVTLAGTTGTAGNFGVTLFKPLALFSSGILISEMWGTNQFSPLINGGKFFEKIEPGACLSVAGSRLGTNAVYQLSMTFVEVS